MRIVDVKCVKSNAASFAVGGFYKVIIGCHGDKTVTSDSGYSYNLNANLQHNENIAFELVQQPKHTLIKQFDFILPPMARELDLGDEVKSCDYVKVCAVPVGCEEPREIFWVQIKGIDIRTDPVTWRAQVANDLQYTALHGLKDGDLINVPRDCMVALLGG